MAQQDRINGLIGTLGMKAPVRVATTANITLSGEQTIDGVAVVAGDRVLVKDQTTGSENGIYAVATTAWAREPDFDGARDAVKGTQVLVSEGAISAGLHYRVTSSDPIVVGTSSIAFAVGAMTSLQLKGIISDETGSGALVFADTPTLVTPILGTPSSGTLTNCTGLPQAGVTGLTTADSPQFTGVNVGHASDTTLTRVSAGVLAVEGSNLLTAATGLPLSGGTLTGDIIMSGASIIETEGAAVASAATCNIWTTDGGTKHITGTTGISSLGTAPQAGMWMKIVFDGVLTLTHGANLNLPGSANITTAAGDFAFVYADTTTQLDVLYFRKDGTAVVSSGASAASAASQAEEEAASSTTVYTSPGSQKFHPGVAKAWAYVTVSGGTPTLQAGYNISGITDTATGKLTVTMTTAFSSANWAAQCLAAIAEGSTQASYESSSTAKTASAVLLANVLSSTGNGADPVAWNFVGFGGQ